MERRAEWVTVWESSQGVQGSVDRQWQEVHVHVPSSLNHDWINDGRPGSPAVLPVGRYRTYAKVTYFLSFFLCSWPVPALSRFDNQCKLSLCFFLSHPYPILSSVSALTAILITPSFLSCLLIAHARNIRSDDNNLISSIPSLALWTVPNFHLHFDTAIL